MLFLTLIDYLKRLLDIVVVFDFLDEEELLFIFKKLVKDPDELFLLLNPANLILSLCSTTPKSLFLPTILYSSSLELKSESSLMLSSSILTI